MFNYNEYVHIYIYVDDVEGDLYDSDYGVMLLLVMVQVATGVPTTVLTSLKFPVKFEIYI